MKDFSVFGFYSSFWKYKPLTPEEDETLKECKAYITKSLMYTSAIGMLITTGVNCNPSLTQSTTGLTSRFLFGYSD